MDRKQFNIILCKIENIFWSLQQAKYYIKSKQNRELLKKNRVFNKVHEGQTCFILGNGPSLKLENRLSEISKYTVFTVNQFYRSELFAIVKPDYHVMIDPLFFNLDENNNCETDTLIRIREIAANPDIKMIFPVDAYEFVNKKIGNSNEHIYIKGRYLLHKGYNRKILLNKYIPTARNVVQTAIYCAIAMGFKRIVILGCDMTGLFDNYIRRSPQMDQEKFTHVYEYTKEETERMKKVHEAYDNEFILSGFTTMFSDFKVINEMCEKNKIEISNASQITAIDSLPYSSLNSILDLLEAEV